MKERAREKGRKDDDEGMLGTGYRFAGQIGTLGKVESASIRSTAAAARNEEMIVPEVSLLL